MPQQWTPACHKEQAMSFFQRFLENGPEKAGNESVPYRATYAASKGFGLLFAEALAREVEDHGVRVCEIGRAHV